MWHDINWSMFYSPGLAYAQSKLANVLHAKALARRLEVKFIYSEKATKFCEIFTLLLTTVLTVKSKGKVLQNFVAFSEYMNFNLSQEHMVSFLAFRHTIA